MSLKYKLAAVLTLLLSQIQSLVAIRGFDEFLKLPSAEQGFPGQKWALLIAGSSGYYNYRHQADICHAYQILRSNGLPDENIVVFMADDIAHNPENPYPGTIINRPFGEDVYANVPKDYTGWNVTVNNFLAALKGDKDAIQGGSGKVIASGPHDHVFVFYSDHGGPGILGMPTYPFLYADQVVNTLIKKRKANGFQHLVFYLEACESGSIFEGLLPYNINVYATTAANAEESSWGTYCPGMVPAPPEEFETCLGDLYSVAWMEDSERSNLAKETLNEQYLIVKERTSNHKTYDTGSHVMQYGDTTIYPQKAAVFLGSNPENKDLPPPVVPGEKGKDLAEDVQVEGLPEGLKMFLEGKKVGTVQQRDADLLHFWHKFKNAPQGSARKSQALREISEMTAFRAHVDHSVGLIGQLLLGAHNSVGIRPSGAALVEDWDCLRAMVDNFESKCGRLSQYGMKHTATFAKLCNSGVSPIQLAETAQTVCSMSSLHNTHQA